MSRHDPGARRSPMLAVGSVALATSLIGTIGTAAELGPDSLDAVAMGSWRAVIGGAGLLAASLIRKEAPWRYPLPARWVVLGALMVAGVQLSFFEAVSRTGVAVGTLVMIGSSVVAGGGIDWLAHKHRPGGRWLVGVVVAVGGVALLSGGSPDVVWSGVALAVVAGCGITTFGFSAQQLMRDRPLLPAMTTIIVAGALLLLPLALTSVEAAFASTASVVTIAYLGLVTVTCAQTLWGSGLKHLRLSIATVVGLMEPAVAATLAMTVLDEPVTPALVTGIFLVISGVAITSLNPGASTRFARSARIRRINSSR
ncbi:MAG: DMT family transporter [bacterium]|nr:DMT family transporter [Acidimicrobiia bacterium]MCY4650476.1 DMT family transporter [bacterium]